MFNIKKTNARDEPTRYMFTNFLNVCIVERLMT